MYVRTSNYNSYLGRLVPLDGWERLSAVIETVYVWYSGHLVVLGTLTSLGLGLLKLVIDPDFSRCNFGLLKASKQNKRGTAVYQKSIDILKTIWIFMKNIRMYLIFALLKGTQIKQNVSNSLKKWFLSSKYRYSAYLSKTKNSITLLL